MSFGRVREGFRPQIRADGLTKATRGGVVVPCSLAPPNYVHDAYLITTCRKLKKACLYDGENLTCPLCTGSALLVAVKSRVVECKTLDCTTLRIVVSL